MKFYTNLAKIVLVVFVLNICFMFTGVAHDPCASERAKEAAKKVELDSAIYTRNQIDSAAVKNGQTIGTIAYP